jgi:two-component system, LytTR family, response regulator AgrA
LLNFIVLDDEKTIRENTKKIINKLMMPYDFEYSIKIFNDYNADFKNIITKKTQNKIYILDIELPSKSGIDIARKIREKDWESTIIFLTAHYDLGLEAIKNRLMLLDFISKFNDYEENLKNAIEIAIKIINKQKTLDFEYDKVFYKIKLDDILYITRDSVERKTIIKTVYSEYKINKKITDIFKKLDCRFFQTHRSCIINKDHINELDLKNNCIKFSNQEVLYVISREEEKGVERICGN